VLAQAGKEAAVRRSFATPGAGATLAIVGLAIAVFGGGVAYWQVQGGPRPVAQVPSPSPEQEPSISDGATDAAPKGEAASPKAASPNAEPLNPSASQSASNPPLKALLESNKQKPPQSDFAWGAAKKPEPPTPEFKPRPTAPAADDVRVDDLALDQRSRETSLPIRDKKPVAPPRPRLAPKDAISHDESWYWFSEERVTVHEAQAIANRVKGRLVTITSDEENQFIVEHLKGPTFLGLLKVKNIWLDPGGRPQNYFRWDRGQPSSAAKERFAAIHTSGRWHDYLEDRLFLCIEWGREP
jgi:hypothetical protein